MGHLGNRVLRKTKCKLITEPGDRVPNAEMHNRWLELAQKLDGVDERIITDETNGGGLRCTRNKL